MPNKFLLTAVFSLSVLLGIAQSALQKKSGRVDGLNAICHSLKYSNAVEHGKQMQTTLYYPAKATNYIWNTLTSNWDFFDTTLYTYTGTGYVTNATRKDNSNNFIARTLTTYDTSFRVIESIYQTWSSGWLNNHRDTFVFDNYNQMIRHEYHTWNNSQWNIISGDLFLNTYNASGKITLQVTQTWNGTSWVNSSRKTHTYNGNDQVVLTIAESWNTSLSSWQNTSQTDYTYDVSNINTQTVFKIWNGSAFVNFNQSISIVWSSWTGDIATSKPQSYTFQTWSGSAWVNAQRLFNATYDSFGGSIELFQQWISNNWVNDARYTDFFDTQYNKTGERNEAWNIPLAMWDTSYEYRYLFNYDANNSITQSIYQQYDNSVHAYVNYTKTIYSDFLFLDVAEIKPQTEISVSLFPNPAEEFVNVNVSSENFVPVAYSMSDVSGKIIFTEATRSTHIRLNRNNISSGIYLLTISGESGELISRKLIVR
jgi:hypothetical protein